MKAMKAARAIATYRRIDGLLAEQVRINKEIEAIQNGQMRVLPEESTLERIREIISLADGLTGDFRRVRDQFDQLNRELKEKLIDNEGSQAKCWIPFSQELT